MPGDPQLYFEYELELGSERAQSLLFVSEELSLSEVIRDELALSLIHI